MGEFETKRLYNPQFTGENRLSPRATVIPALHSGVFYKNRLESELILDLNGSYKFCYRKEDDISDFYSLAFDDSDWDNLSVPSMWQYHGYSLPVYPNIEYPIPFVPPFVGSENPVGYYRKRFTAEKGGKKILYFGGVDCAFFVYLNGEYIGFSKGSRIPAEFDVTKYLEDGENLLAVKVFTYSDGTYMENQDMLLASGIFRDVMLYTLNDEYVWDYHIRTENNKIIADITLEGSDFTDTEVTFSVNKIKETKQASKSLSFIIEIENPTQWNAELPFTYTVNIELNKKGKLLEIHTKKIGFAEFELKDNAIKLNGRQITIKGINRHEHDPKNGRAVTVELIEKELRLIKAHNFNAIRGSHYPNNPAFYEICTELGIYVMNEADIETHGAWLCGDMGYFSKHPDWYDAYFDRVSRMYERDKNETCISIWTLGNENGDGENLHKCFKYLREQDPKRPIMLTGDDRINPVYSDFRFIAYFTMAKFKDYEGEGKPVMMLEYGHAMGNSPGLMKDTWDYVYKHRHVAGGYVWEFKNHGYYSEDKNGRVFYKYGGDFGDINHWSNFSMDGYCLSDGTPKPSLTECKNVLAPTYVYSENDKIYLMNTNDFRPLDYITMRYSITEDYNLIRNGEEKLTSVMPYESVELKIDTKIDSPKAGAEYFLNIDFTDENGNEIAKKQVSLGILIPKKVFTAEKEAWKIAKDENNIEIILKDAKIRFNKGMLYYYEKDGKVLLNEPIKLNLYRAPTDNDGVVNWAERWITKWNKALYPYFNFFMTDSSVTKADDSVNVNIIGKWAPISKYEGFDIEIAYTVYKGGKILVNLHGTPYGEFAATLPRIGFIIPLNSSFSAATWYGRGEDECYCDRCEHCNFGLYSKNIADMNFMYDIPQECGTRVDTRFLKIANKESSLSVVGSDSFTFSYHDFSLDDLIKARHRNELNKSDKNYLYVDYQMRGIGSHSCGPDPEECYELRPHEFRFAFMLCAEENENELLTIARSDFGIKTAKLSGTHVYVKQPQKVSMLECNINTD